MSQRTLWDWRAHEEGEPGEGGMDFRTRGFLDLSELSEIEAPRRAQGHQLHWQLECHLGTVDLVVTDNRRRMVTAKSARGRFRIRLHHMFLGCDPETVAAIVALARGEDQARSRIQRYIEFNREEISFRPEDEKIEPEGEHFDLSEILESVERLLPEEQSGSADGIAITWGREGRGAKSIRFGSYDFDQRLIRVHPALDQDWVPRYFVAFIVYHELLHAICPPREGEEDRRVHTREFKELERAFPRYEDAMEWESENLSRILNRDT